jgi:hypothetical protein
MTIEQLARHLHAQPFAPFRIHLADGRSLDVFHPDVLAHGGGRTFVVYTSEEEAETVDLLLVTRLATIKADGQAGRRRRTRG